MDLGPGTHQGWLRTRKPRKNKWDECHKWCVIKEADLFVYASQMVKYIFGLISVTLWLDNTALTYAEYTQCQGYYELGVHMQSGTY